VRGGGGMSHRIVISSRTSPALRATGWKHAGHRLQVAVQQWSTAPARSTLLFTIFTKICAVMPRGSSPGERRGGRAKGAKNKSTLERALVAERIIAEQQGTPGRKLGKELLEEFATMFAGLAAAFQPIPSVAGQALSAADMETWARSYKEPFVREVREAGGEVRQ
jgi:hypothetical protein